eukprot:GEMP01054125.1.p1 GENE.GEMP01054125.1~~GEMP01054125.1.p1  ORF type:complete len:288 (+),score=66.13 GEMP01054125.1:271-1134(+)
MHFRESYLLRVHTYLCPWEWRPATNRLFRSVVKRPGYLAALLGPLLHRTPLSTRVGAPDAHRWALAFAECGHLDSLNLLAEACGRQSVDAAKMLLRIGADPDGWNDDQAAPGPPGAVRHNSNSRPLHRAICSSKRGDSTDVQDIIVVLCTTLVEAGCCTTGAAHLACVVDNVPVLQLFNNDIDSECMRAAAVHGSMNCLCYCIKSKKCGDIDICLHGATKAGQVEIVRLLLEARADPNGLNEEGQTPLGIATHRSSGFKGRKVFPALSTMLRAAGASLGQFNPTLYG